MEIGTIEVYDYSGQPIEDYYHSVAGTDSSHARKLRQQEEDALPLGIGQMPNPASQTEAVYNKEEK